MFLRVFLRIRNRAYGSHSSAQASHPFQSSAGLLNQPLSFSVNGQNSASSSTSNKLSRNQVVLQDMFIMSNSNLHNPIASSTTSAEMLSLQSLPSAVTISSSKGEGLDAIAMKGHEQEDDDEDEEEDEEEEEQQSRGGRGRQKQTSSALLSGLVAITNAASTVEMFLPPPAPLLPPAANNHNETNSDTNSNNNIDGNGRNKILHPKKHRIKPSQIILEPSSSSSASNINNNTTNNSNGSNNSVLPAPMSPPPKVINIYLLSIMLLLLDLM